MQSNPFQQRVAPKSRDDGNMKLHQLPFLEEFRVEVKKGLPIYEIARWLQEEKKVFTDTTRETLIRMIYRFKARIPVGERIKVSPRAAQAQITKERAKVALELERIDNSVDEVSEMSKLYRLQKERIEIDVARERENKKLFGATANDVRLALDMLVRLANLKMELGVYQKQLGTGTVKVQTQTSLEVLSTRYTQPEVQKVLGNAESRRKVLHVAQHLIAYAGKGSDGQGSAELLQALLGRSMDEAPAEVVEGQGAYSAEVDAGDGFPEEGTAEVDLGDSA